MNNPKIVVIEDDDVLSKVVCDALSEAGFEVLQALDGEKGLEMVALQKPDLVLLDLLLPKKDGFEVLEELKKSSITHDIPVIILSMLSGDNIKKGLGLGASDYIVKSQHVMDEIVEKVKDFFNK